MTKQDFIYSLPPMLVHPTWGECQLEILADTTTYKSAAYRDKLHNLNYTQMGATWQEVHERMREAFIKMGQIAENPGSITVEKT